MLRNNINKQIGGSLTNEYNLKQHKSKLHSGNFKILTENSPNVHHRPTWNLNMIYMYAIDCHKVEYPLKFVFAKWSSIRPGVLYSIWTEGLSSISCKSRPTHREEVVASRKIWSGLVVTSGGSRILCFGRANRTGIFVWGVKKGLSADGTKLRLPKERSPSRLGGLGERRKLPQRSLGRSPRSRRNF